MITNNQQQTMRDAMRLMSTGDLAAATALIQRGLADASAEPHVPHSSTSRPPLDGDFRVVGEEFAARDDALRPDASIDAPMVETGTHESAHGALDYLVYAPRERSSRPAPVLLMLHGCTQDAADFARGTRMHVQAAEEGYVVVYPTQSKRANPNGCWNWFRPTDQRRDLGEPAVLASLVAAMTHRYSVDGSRAFVAGLSAGGAMAVTLGQAYPDVFRGIGAHSGLPHASAHDVPSALAAMRNAGARAHAAEGARVRSAAVPTIVFHGDRDSTVNVRNGVRIVEEARRASAPDATGNANKWSDSTTEGRAAGGRSCTTTRSRDAAGKVRVEQWIVHGGGHAWYGGSAAGSYTDPKGPDATAEMLRFFRELD